MSEQPLHRLAARVGLARDWIDANNRPQQVCDEVLRQVLAGLGHPAHDNAAIAAWLEAAYPQPALMGTTPAEKAAIASWQWRAEFDGLFAVAEALRNGSPAMANRALPGPVDYPQIPELAQRGVARISQFLVTLNEQLSAHEFVAGASFSVADITACVAVDFARVVKVKPDERHPHLLRWRAQLGQRPSFAL